MKNFLHHLEYSESGLDSASISKMIKDKKILYNYKVDQKKNKWESEILLKSFPIEGLPDYIFNNNDKFKDWLER